MSCVARGADSALLFVVYSSQRWFPCFPRQVFTGAEEAAVEEPNQVFEALRDEVRFRMIFPIFDCFGTWMYVQLQILVRYCSQILRKCMYLIFVCQIIRIRCRFSKLIRASRCYHRTVTILYNPSFWKTIHKWGRPKNYTCENWYLVWTDGPSAEVALKLTVQRR